METISAPITGREEKIEHGEHGALVQFYRAFNGADMPLMRRNWLDAEDIAMDNPLGGIRRGWGEIGKVYEKLFGSSAKVYVEFHDYSLHVAQDIFYAVGRERGLFEQAGEKIDLAIRTSRIFRRVEGAWRQVHHHGSIEDPELLARYRRAVLGI